MTPFYTRIRVHDLNHAGLLDAVLRELPDLCDSFTCYPKEGLIIVQGRFAGDLQDDLNFRHINTEHIVIKDI